MQIFRFISFKEESLWALEIGRICMRRSRFALQSRSSGFPYKSLQFCKFSSYHKIFAFRFKSLEISVFPNILPLFLSPIVICQQLLLVVINNSSEIHFAVHQSLEIIGHVTNCCKRPIQGCLTSVANHFVNT